MSIWKVLLTVVLRKHHAFCSKIGVKENTKPPQNFPFCHTSIAFQNTGKETNEAYCLLDLLARDINEILERTCLGASFGISLQRLDSSEGKISKGRPPTEYLPVRFFPFNFLGSNHTPLLLGASWISSVDKKKRMVRYFSTWVRIFPQLSNLRKIGLQIVHNWSSRLHPQYQQHVVFIVLGICLLFN